MASCSICSKPLDDSEDEVTTDSGTTFHRTCLQKLLVTTSKTDYENNNTKHTTSASTEIPDRSLTNSACDTRASEETWQCRNCSRNNTESTKRCDSCGKQKFTRPPSIDESITTGEHYDYSSSPKTEHQTHHHRAESGKTDTEHYHADYATTASTSTSSSQQKKSKEENIEQRSQEKKYADRLSQPISQQPTSFSQAKAKPSYQMEPKRARSPSPSRRMNVIYIPDLPSHIEDNLELENLVRGRTETILKTKLDRVRCYSKLGIGVIHVSDNQVKDDLLNKQGKIALDPKDGKYFITFTETIELVSYVVLNVTKELKDEVLPQSKEVIRRWIDLHKGDEPISCSPLNAQFPNIYRIVSSSLDELINTSYNGVFSINPFLAHIYYCADCSFLEDLSRSITQDRLEKAIVNAIGQTDISSTSLYIEVNKQINTACIIVTDMARIWSTKSFLFIDEKTLSKKTNLTCRLLIYPIPQAFPIDKIINHTQLEGAVTKHKHSGENLILELSDKNVFDRCINLGAICIDKKHLFHMVLYDTSNNPEGNEIDDDTWYETDMLKYKPDIMQFVIDLQHPIFRFKWNSQAWLNQFKRVASHKRDGNRSHTTDNDIRHQLRVTVMLNTLGTIRKRRCMIGDQEVILNLKKELKTIVYDHHSKLERNEKIPLTNAPYTYTKIRVIRGDCLVVYEDLVRDGKHPLLLNMASATSPGGGFRKGDGAQEENIFRRSDYCRSLDVGLDDFFQERPERFHCSSNCQLDPVYMHKSMYPMDAFGAIYTAGITVFRKPEDTGYAFMETPLEDVCSLAMAACRDPELQGSMLGPKYAVGMRKKIENIFAIAYHHKHDSLVLSALGCGAFKNPPDHVAKLFRSVIEQYAGFFKLIVFAIVDDHNAGHHLNPEGNFRPFADVFEEETIVKPITSMDKPNTIFGPYRLLSDGSTVSDNSICDLTPCNYAAKCTEIYDPNHSSRFSHPPLCTQAAMFGKCNSTNDIVHMNSFIHRNQCRNGGECQQINDEKHTREFEHPEYCPDGGKCQNEKADHLKQYRHLPLCGSSHKCMDYQKEVKDHCKKYRHCALRCPHGNYCVKFHDTKHLDNFQHPFPKPCPRTPFDCPMYTALSESKNIQSLPNATQQHCLEFAHVCKLGRNCSDMTPLHQTKSIHIARHICPFGEKCNKLDQEDHLNSFTHPHIPDIRPPCPYAEKCHDGRKLDHKIMFRHAASSEVGIVRYYGSNENTNFVQNQNDSIARINGYIAKHHWKSLPSGSVPQEIIKWLRTVQPIHRCSPIILESILLHGQVMSREHMEQLKDPEFVANSVLQHSRIRRIEALKIKTCEDDARQYITALVSLEYDKQDFLAPKPADTSLPSDTILSFKPYSNTAMYTNIIKKKENKLSGTISLNDMNALRTKSIAIAQASIKLHSDPAGIGHTPDKALGTDKLVFSVLGPHLGHYYGDVFIIFKREILNHPDTNFTIQAATSIASGNAYQWRPWLGKVPDDIDVRVQQYHSSKLHATVPGYDYAAAIELMALTSLTLKLKSMDISLQQILDRWIKADSHQNIEAHLPRLIPVDYIDHIYIPKNLYTNLNDDAHKAIDALFKHRITIVPHLGEANHEKGPFGPTPTIKSRADYQNFVVKELLERYKHNVAQPSVRSIQGAVITLPSTNFDDHYVLPLTISQAYTQYHSDHSHPPKDNTLYIYWQAVNGDMMVSLSNEEIDAEEKQPNLSCLICYVAPKSTASDNHYYEHTSYITSAHPFQHEMIIKKRKYAAKSNTFYIGCNTDDFISYCLEIQRSTGKVTLCHAGSNSIYNHEEISCIFNRSQFDLAKLEFIHVSAGAQTVPIRNLMICFEKQENLHPTFDKNFKKDTSTVAHTAGDRDGSARTLSSRSSMTNFEKQENMHPTFDKNFKKDTSTVAHTTGDRDGDAQTVSSRSSMTYFEKQENLHPTYDKDSRTKDTSTAVHTTGDRGGGANRSPSLKTTDNSSAKEPSFLAQMWKKVIGKSDSSVTPCPDSVNCLIQHSVNGSVHNSKHSHPCRYSELCREKEPHLTHEPHPSTMCGYNKNCDKLDDPFHRAAHRHTNLPDFLIPCRDQTKCLNTSSKHRILYFHGERVLDKASMSTSATAKIQHLPKQHTAHQEFHDHDLEKWMPCKWGTKCYDHDTDHRANFSHPSTDKSQHAKEDHRILCKWGTKCYDHGTDHRANFSHPSTDKSQHEKEDHRGPCKWGSKCRDHGSHHRAEYTHPDIENST